MFLNVEEKNHYLYEPFPYHHSLIKIASQKNTKKIAKLLTLKMNANNTDFKENTDIPLLVKSAVLRITPAAEVVLFGSRARGDFYAHSDWDFLILLQEKLTYKLKNAILRKLYEIELDTHQLISSIVYEKKEWQNRELMPLYQNILKEGIAV